MNECLMTHKLKNKIGYWVSNKEYLHKRFDSNMYITQIPGSSQCSTTGITMVVVCVMLSVWWCTVVCSRYLNTSKTQSDMIFSVSLITVNSTVVDI